MPLECQSANHCCMGCESHGFLRESIEKEWQLQMGLIER